MQAAVLPFKNISNVEALEHSLTDAILGSDAVKDRAIRDEEFIQKIGPILDSLEPRDAAAAVADGYLTDRQFMLLQWANKQMEIRRLQRQCRGILARINRS